jgi:hypothetical protein
MGEFDLAEEDTISAMELNKENLRKAEIPEEEIAGKMNKDNWRVNAYSRLGRLEIKEGLEILNDKAQDQEAIDQVNRKLEEFKAYEKDAKANLPDWYKGFMLADPDVCGMKDRPFEYVYHAISYRP